MDTKLVEAETEIGKLKLDDHGHDSLFLVGGYDGVNWLSTLHSYSPTNDEIISLKPMSCIRSHASVAKLNGEIYAIGGGNGYLWYDTVESYDPAKDQWTLRPSLSVERGNLAAATLHDKIYAIGGGNGYDYYKDVEMLDLEAGRWISTQSMLEPRYAFAAVELNGALYAIGGYNGEKYSRSSVLIHSYFLMNEKKRSVERLDPREPSWKKIEDMNGMRGCHSAVVLNEKIYVIGGHDEEEEGVCQDVEFYDSRLCSWIEGETLSDRRGFPAACVLNESIYVIGGLTQLQKIEDTVEVYKEGQGWRVTDLKAVGKRIFSSAIVF